MTAYADGWSGVVFRCQNGHWSYQGEGETNSMNETQQRLLDKDTLLFATGYKLYELSPRGTIDHGKSPGEVGADHGEICPIARNLFYFFGRDYRGDVVSKVASGERTELSLDKHKEAFAHRNDNTPLKDYPVAGIRYTRTFAPGKASGIHPGPRGSYRSPKLVSFKEGIWYEMDDLPESTVNDVWFASDGDSLQFLVTVGAEGYVYSHCLRGPKLKQSITAGQETTSLNLIKVWGVSLDKYWVMDKSGTVWQRQSDDWRVVVRGLYREDVKFVAAWVSPRGTVIALTDKHVYRLE